jgi:hypothetical protein
MDIDREKETEGEGGREGGSERALTKKHSRVREGGRDSAQKTVMYLE